MNPRIIWIGAALAAGGVAAWIALPGPDAPDAAPVPPAGLAAASAALPPLPPRQRAPEPAQPVQLGQEDLAFLEQLRARFGPHLADKHARIRAIERIVAYLQERYPQDWRERVRAILAGLSPALAAELVSAFEGLMQLNEWLEANRDALMKLAPAERRAALWAARRAAFGADAEQIYAGEVRSEHLAAAIRDIDVATGLTTDEKLAKFVGAVQDAWGEQAPALIETRGPELLNRFLDVPSVQEDLQAQPAAERSATLRRIRAGLGLDDAALSRWDALDAERDQAWALGQRYWQARAALLAQFTGADLAARLARLQDELFGPEAETIRLEEAAGFYRFEGPRRFGRE